MIRWRVANKVSNTGKSKSFLKYLIQKQKDHFWWDCGNSVLMGRRSPRAQWAPLLMTMLTSTWKLSTSQAVCWGTGKQHTAYFQKANWKPGMMAQCFLQSQQGGRTTVMNSRPPWARVIPLTQQYWQSSFACAKWRLAVHCLVTTVMECSLQRTHNFILCFCWWINGPRRLDAPRTTLLALLLVLSCVLGHKAESKY